MTLVMGFSSGRQPDDSKAAWSGPMAAIEVKTPGNRAFAAK
jgi:hypothetical protein